MSIWNNIKTYAKQHPIRTAIFATIALVGVAALITGIVFSGGTAAVPVAAGLAALIGASHVGVGIGVASVGAVLLGVGGMALVADIGYKTRGQSARRYHERRRYGVDGELYTPNAIELKEIKRSEKEQEKMRKEVKDEQDPLAFKRRSAESVSLGKCKGVKFAQQTKQHDGKSPEVIHGLKVK